MSAAFALEPTGPPVPCDFRGCILECWHEGDHEFGPQSPKRAVRASFHCVVCGQPFEVYGANGQVVFETCGQQACVEHWARRHAGVAPLLCCCRQREFPHEISVHHKVRFEKPGTYYVWDGKQEVLVTFADPGMVWPWSLRLSRREEPSTERKAS